MDSLQSISRGNAEGSFRWWALCIPSQLIKTSASAEAAELAIAATVDSGLFDYAISVIETLGTRTLKTQDTNIQVVYFSLQMLNLTRSYPGCEAKLRHAAGALSFCLDNSMDVCPEMGRTTGGEATQIVCGIFGRDEGGSDFSFSQKQVDTLVKRWSLFMRAEGHEGRYIPNAQTMLALEMVISDENKPKLLNNVAFVPYLCATTLHPCLHRALSSSWH